MAVIVHSHSFDFLSSWDGYSWIKRHILNMKWHCMIRKADHFIVFDRLAAEELVRYYYVPKSKISLTEDGTVLYDVLNSLSGGMPLARGCCWPQIPGQVRKGI